MDKARVKTRPYRALNIRVGKIVPMFTIPSGAVGFVSQAKASDAVKVLYVIK